MLVNNFNEMDQSATYPWVKNTEEDEDGQSLQSIQNTEDVNNRHTFLTQVENTQNPTQAESCNQH